MFGSAKNPPRSYAAIPGKNIHQVNQDYEHGEIFLLF